MQWLQSHGQKEWGVDSFEHACAYKARNYTKCKQAQIRLKVVEVIEEGKGERKRRESLVYNCKISFDIKNKFPDNGAKNLLS